MTDELKNDLLSYARPPVVVSMNAPTDWNLPPQLLKKPTGFGAAYRNGAVHFFWESAGGPDSHFRVYCGTKPGMYQRVCPASGNSLQTNEFIQGHPFIDGRRYYARIAAVSADGQRSQASEEFSFRIQETTDLDYPAIPMRLKFKVLWTNVKALIDDLLLGS